MHPYLDKLHCPEDEPTRDPLDTTDFEFERRKITLPALREAVGGHEALKSRRFHAFRENSKG